MDTSQQTRKILMTKILLLLGGNWHDFEGFTAAFQSYFPEDDVQIEATYNADKLLALDEEKVDLVAIYTCLGGSNQHGRIAEDMKPEQIDALCRWAQRGGKVLGVHSATVMGEAQTQLRQLLGGRFLSHPPQFDFTVAPLFREHPTTAGIGAFAVHDEFYIQAYNADVQIHMVASDRGVAYPMVWTRSEDAGKVAYVAPGHTPSVWAQPAYRQLLRQSVDWLLS
jgi:uncharacterized protein